MREVAIVGAGDLGGALAHAVARLDVARSIRLIDDHAAAAQGKALDIMQAGPIEGFATRLSGAADSSYAASADLVVIADRFGAGDWPVDEALARLRRLGRAFRAPIVCASPNAAPLVDRAARDLEISRERLVGSAPEAAAATARALVALAVNGSPRDVALSVIGVPPSHTIVVWNDATYAGQALTRLLNEPVRRRLAQRVSASWPPGPQALAAAAAKVVACIDGRSRQVASCLVAPDRSNGERSRVAALPVRLGPGGVIEVVMPSLTAGEQVALDNALRL